MWRFSFECVTPCAFELLIDAPTGSLGRGAELDCWFGKSLRLLASVPARHSAVDMILGSVACFVCQRSTTNDNYSDLAVKYCQGDQLGIAPDLKLFEQSAAVGGDALRADAEPGGYFQNAGAAGQGLHDLKLATGQ